MTFNAFAIWWTAAGAALYMLCLVLTIKLNMRAAWGAAMPTPVIAIYTCMPAVVWLGSRYELWGAVLASLPFAVLAVVPLHIYNRRREAGLRRAEQRRADDAELLIRRFGA